MEVIISTISILVIGRGLYFFSDTITEYLYEGKKTCPKETTFY